MENFTQAILQIGVAPAIAGFLLYDYSKKLAAMQVELVKINEILRNRCASEKEMLEAIEELARRIK